MLRSMLVGVLMLVAGSVYAQDPQTVGQITVNKADLPAALVQQLETKQKVESTLQTYGKWAGMGKEIGSAMREGLGALNDEANRFADTKVGVFVMFIIAFKVLGYPILQFLVGVPLMIVGTVLFILWFRKACMPHRVLVSKTVDKSDGKVFPTTTCKYDTEEQTYKEGAEILGIIVFVLFIGVCTAITFAH